MVKFDKSLEEVWEWKKKAYVRTKRMSIRDLVKHIHGRLHQAKKNRLPK